ncbi:MAG: hypothetical protein FJ264_04825 [Planctomycetes bacterium]|nr:hypothetical protein [Planctomycetota bacterium]
MSAILELFNGSYSSQKMPNEMRQDTCNSVSGVKDSTTGFVKDELENTEDGENLPFEELLTQHTSPTAKKTEGKNTKNPVEKLSKTTTGKTLAGEETEGNTNTTELEELSNFYNMLASETAIFSDADKAKVLAALKNILQSLQTEGISLNNISIVDSASPDGSETEIVDSGISHNTIVSAEASGQENKELSNILAALFKATPSKTENKDFSSFDSETEIVDSGISHNTIVSAEASGQENKELSDILAALFKATPSKTENKDFSSFDKEGIPLLVENKRFVSSANEGISLQPNVVAENKDFSFSVKKEIAFQSSEYTENRNFPSIDKEGISLPAEDKDSSSLNKLFTQRSAILESFIFNTNAKGMTSPGNSSITNMPSPTANEGIVSQLNGLLNNYNDTIILSELSLPNSETREAYKSLKSLLQTIINEGKNNVSAFNSSMEINNSMSGVTGFTMNMETKASDVQKTFLHNAAEENNGFAKNITNDTVSSAGKNENKNGVSKEGTESLLYHHSGSFQANEEGNSSGNFSQQGNNTFTFANINNQQEKILVNDILPNNPDFQQKMAEAPNGTTPNIVSPMGEQKTAVSRLFQGNSPANSNTVQNNVMEQILENIKTLQHGNRSEIKLQLTPPELGTVKLHFTEENDEIRAKIYVENTEVKAAIQNNIHRLKESIATNGVEIHKLEVYVQNENRNEQEQQQSFANFAANDSQYHGGARDDRYDGENNTEENEKNPKVFFRKNKIVNSSNLTIDYVL